LIQPSLSFLALPIPAALKCVASLSTLEHMPSPLRDGLVDTILALFNCLSEGTEEFDDLMDNGGLEFNMAAEATRILSPLAEKVSYPLHTEYGTMLEDTPLVMVLAPGKAMDLLKECAEHEKSLRYDTDAQALFDMTWKLTHTYPSIADELDILLDEGGVDYYAEAHKLLTEAMSPSTSQDQLGMAA
jgi:hypothetical protein